MPVFVRRLFGIGKLPADVRAEVEAEQRFRRHRVDQLAEVQADLLPRDGAEDEVFVIADGARAAATAFLARCSVRMSITILVRNPIAPATTATTTANMARLPPCVRFLRFC